jgi:hypothetical protein
LGERNPSTERGFSKMAAHKKPSGNRETKDDR